MSTKLYVVKWIDTNRKTNECAHTELHQALVRFGKQVERYEYLNGINLMIDWSSITGGRDLGVGEYIVAFVEGGDMVGDAKVWIRATYQHNYST